MVTSFRNKASWRDPAGFVINSNGQVLRAVHDDYLNDFQKFLSEDWVKRRIEIGDLPETIALKSLPSEFEDGEGLNWFRHKVLHFPCYPHEILPNQLFDSAKLTLDLALEAIDNEWSLKDASAWNVLHEGGRAVFCDMLSFERITPSCVWRPYGQFCRHFLIPLFLYAECDYQPAHQFLINRDGVEPDSAASFLNWSSLWRPVGFELFTMPKFLSRLSPAYSMAIERQGGSAVSIEMAKYAQRRTIRRLNKILEKLNPSLIKRDTTWWSYRELCAHYGYVDRSAKHSFITRCLSRINTGTVLDLGCNSGEYSVVAASNGMSVVGADFDYGALGRLYSEVRQFSLPITPVLLNLSRPTPAIGWLNSEIPSFFDRARGKFDYVFALGLIHHLIVIERLTVQMIMDLFLAISSRFLVIEWIEPSDPKFLQIAQRTRFDSTGLTLDSFEKCFFNKYILLEKVAISGGNRVLYFFEFRADIVSLDNSIQQSFKKSNPTHDDLKLAI